MEPRNEELIRLFSQLKAAGYDPTKLQQLQISAESPKQKMGVGRWIGNKLKSAAKAVGKQLLVFGALGGAAVGAHYLAKKRSVEYETLANRWIEPQVRMMGQLIMKNPKTALARMSQFAQANWLEKGAMVAGVAADAYLSEFELYRKYLQKPVRTFVTWAFDNRALLAGLFTLFTVGGGVVKSVGATFFLVHCVAYHFEEDYRNWFIALGLPGSVIAIFTKIVRKEAIQQLIEQVKNGVNFVKDVITKLTEAYKNTRDYWRGATDEEQHQRRLAEQERRLKSASGDCIPVGRYFNTMPWIRTRLACFGPRWKAQWLPKGKRRERDTIYCTKLNPDGSLSDQEEHYNLEHFPEEFVNWVKSQAYVLIDCSFSQCTYSEWDHSVVEKERLLTAQQKATLLDKRFIWRIGQPRNHLECYMRHTGERVPENDLRIKLPGFLMTMRGRFCTEVLFHTDSPTTRDPRYIRIV